MELAAALHHSAYKGASQMTVNSGRMRCSSICTAKTQQARPHRLAGVRLQERVKRHTVEQIGDSAPYLPSLDVPVLLMGEQLLEAFRLLDTVLPEQVIDEPQISQDRIQQRLVDRDLRHSQMAEKLVEVPTVLSPSLLQQLFVEQIVDNPVPRGRGDHGGLQHFFTQYKVRSALLSRSLTFLLVEVLKIFPLILGWRPHPQFRVVSLGKVFFFFFELFPDFKKCEVRREFECEGARALELMDAGGLRAHASAGGLLRG